MIGLTRPDRRGLTQNLFIRLGLFIAGARVIDLVPSKRNLSASIDGLVVAGGTDIFPGIYANEDIKKDYPYDEARDEFETAWIRRALDEKIPLFCICRGAQLLNVILGGNLHTDVKKFFENANYPRSILAKIFFRKAIRVNSDSLIYKALGKEVIEVNSMHSQSIAELGAGVRVTSKENNGIVQSIELSGDHYVVGVQFHPEFLIYRREIRALFRQFIDQCDANSR